MNTILKLFIKKLVFLSKDKSIKSFFNESIIYSIFNIVNRIIPFALLPFLTRMVSTEEFGYYSLYVNIETMLIPIVTLNSHVAISTHYYKGIDIPLYISTIIYALFFLCIPFYLLSLIFNDFFYSILGISKINFSYSIIVACLMALFSMISYLFRLRRDPISYGWFTMLNSILLFSFIISATLINADKESIIIGRLSYAVVFAILCLFYLFKKKMLLFEFDKKYFFDALKFSLPTVIFSLSTFVFASSDRFFINYFLDKTQLGIYAGLYQIAAAISIIFTSFNTAWMPWLFEKLDKIENSEEEKKSIVRLSYFLIIFFLIISALYCLLYEFIVKLVLPPVYYDFTYIGYPLIFGFAFDGIYLIISPYIFYKEKTKYNGIIGITIAILSVILNMFFIPRFGIIGASISTLITWIVLAVLFFIFSYKVYPMPWLLKKNK